MGVVNVTPDSFSDGGQYFNSDEAIEHGLQLIKEGANILDIGGESTRPNAEPVSIEEEINRILPVIEGLLKHKALISVDTRHTEVMKVAIEAGCHMINDVSALRDHGAIGVVANSDISVCLMHMQGAPKNMQESPNYNNVVEDVYSFLEQRINECISAGITKDRLIVDVGIGFGKTLEHNLLLLKNLGRFAELGVPQLLGTSRKSFIGKIDEVAKSPKDRMGGSLATVIEAYKQGVQIFRVHDVKETKQALLTCQAIEKVA